MPTYEYRCKDCGNHLEVVQSFTDEALTECPSCKVTLKRRFQPGDKYVTALTAIWSAGLRRAFTEVPPVPWTDEES